MSHKSSPAILDLRGVPCPQNVSRLLLKLGGMDSGDVLEVVLDAGEPYDNVIESLKVEQINFVEVSSDNTKERTLRVSVK
jgi:TusA-related sulfurtransferase